MDEAGEDESEGATDVAEGDTYIFTDSAGREVELPTNLERVASGGPLANIMIYSVRPEVLVGWSSAPSDSAMDFIVEEYWDLPEYGKFYDNQSGFNREALMASDLQVIIDVGEWDEEYVKGLDELQEQVGIPVIIIDGNLENTAEGYRLMGDVLGEEERGEELAAYTEDILEGAEEAASQIPEDEKKTVYFAEREDGLSTILSGTIHAQTVEMVGGIVVADPATAESQQGGGTVSMEQLLSWDPDVIFFFPGSIYDSAADDPSWQALSAIANDTYYEVPGAPYNWISRPPGPNRIVGINWMGQLLYPEYFDNDIVEETKEFYELFYRYELSDDEVEEILGNSTLK
ncbi:ABC transporter substrate-binding protein [Flaviflexus massiliensis]|uniref:ABC transporter substrate-binding protein n=1 Tax=Flaviflexus massiliensis TaxID=1522309 RepID=UPI0006D579F2|nr:ABC transporter substrate-binding protein [Flaviflexus massiliensis]